MSSWRNPRPGNSGPGPTGLPEHDGAERRFRDLADLLFEDVNGGVEIEHTVIEGRREPRQQIQLIGAALIFLVELVVLQDGGSDTRDIFEHLHEALAGLYAIGTPGGLIARRNDEEHPHRAAQPQQRGQDSRRHLAPATLEDRLVITQHTCLGCAAAERDGVDGSGANQRARPTLGRRGAANDLQYIAAHEIEEDPFAMQSIPDTLWDDVDQIFGRWRLQEYPDELR